MSNDEGDERVWNARKNVISLWEDAKESENEVLKNELEDIEHRLCLVEQITRGGSSE